ncbi:MAG: hypothetical protein ABSG95_14185 [Solirubrobacteraceae bacterium]|jgi:hypothetical protein
MSKRKIRTLQTHRPPAALAGVVAVVAVVAATALPGGSAVALSGTRLTGTLEIAPGRYVPPGRGQAAHYSGSYFRMLLPGATDKYFRNPNSKAQNKTYTLFVPGTEGGLRLASYQEPPSPAFASDGFALASSIVRPMRFAGIDFSISTAPTDAQSGQPDVAPSLNVVGDQVIGNLSAWTAEWNGIYFNQGSPKPGGSYPGLTRPVIGTYNSRTRAYQIIWYSLIVGGPFNGFTGYWHLQGTLKPTA